jgi:hypothetical protein
MPDFVKIISFKDKKITKGGIRHMEDFTAKFTESLMGNLFSTSLEEVARQGAELMLKLVDIQIYLWILLVYTTDSNMMT